MFKNDIIESFSLYKTRYTHCYNILARKIMFSLNKKLNKLFCFNVLSNSAGQWKMHTYHIVMLFLITF